MPRYLYRPGHPHADEQGFITVDAYYHHKFMTTEDKRMMVGNEPVVLRFISDEMAPTRHMSNGKLYTSKKKFRDETKARGCIEVGNETKTMLTPRTPKRLSKKERVEDIKKAIYQLQNGMVQKPT